MIRFGLNESVEARRDERPPPAKQSRRGRTMWRLIEILLLAVVQRYQRNAVDFVKIQATTYYVKAIGRIRRIVMRSIVFACLLLLLLAGFIMIHVGFFTFFNWSNRVKGGVLFILGVIYFVIALGTILYATSEGKWMKFSGASQMVENVMKEKHDSQTKG
ncbi:MAG: hypothetical protein WC975_15525 [Phycisphaerae bacterium]